MANSKTAHYWIIVISGIFLIIFSLIELSEEKRYKKSDVEYREPEYSEYHDEGYSVLDAVQHSRKVRAVQAGECVSDSCKSEILRIPLGYNFFEIPFQPSIGNYTPPINVTMKARVESIRDIDEVKEEITLDMEITLGWTDWKIFKFRKNMTDEEVTNYIKSGEHQKRPVKMITINNPEYLKTIWKPNLYIYDLIEKTQPKLMSDLITLRYDPNGGFIYYLTRVILKLSCPMEFQYYPTDTQKCDFRIRGFSYNEDLLNLAWYKPPYLADRDESNFDVQLNTFSQEKLLLRDEIYNGLTFTLLLRRKLSFHIVQTYIPSSFFIIITWLCFLIPSTMVEARIGISMTTLLTLTAMFASVRETSPVSAYVKALDIWMVSCIFSVFLTLFEFTLLTWLRHLKAEKDEKAKLEVQASAFVQGEQLSTPEGKRQGDTVKPATSASQITLTSSSKDEADKFEFYVKIIEKFAFAVFFVLFVVFNGVYWSWLFNSSGFTDWPEINATLNTLDS